MSAEDGGPAAHDDPAPTHAPFARLKKRSEFLAVAKGARLHEPAFTLQAAKRADAPEVAGPARRFGLTVTKKTGNSVVRNRIRRRLREAIRQSGAARGEMPDGGSRDYVVVARRDALACDFAALRGGLDAALAKIDRRLDRPRSR